jgi:hypothetical protein
MGVPAHFYAKRFSEQPLEWLRVTGGGPQLQLGVAAGPNLQQTVLAAVMQIDARHRL